MSSTSNKVAPASVDFTLPTDAPPPPPSSPTPDPSTPPPPPPIIPKVKKSRPSNSAQQSDNAAAAGTQDADGEETDMKMTGRSSTTSANPGATKKKEAPEGQSKMKNARHALADFWQSFSAALFSPVFLRHRNIFLLLFEMLAPGLVTLIIFGAFTSGLTWKLERSAQQSAHSRILNYPEITMDKAMAKFRSAHTDPLGRSLLLYTPANNLTAQIMLDAMNQLGLQTHNRLFRHGQGATGVIGMESEVELMERAMFHKIQATDHGKPAGVLFRMSEDNRSEVTGLPWNITFSIRLFDDSILKSELSPADSESWESPYITSGFVGLQYAIEQSIIRLILERQREGEVQVANYSKLNYTAEVGSRSKDLSSSAEGDREQFDSFISEFMKAEDVRIAEEGDDGGLLQKNLSSSSSSPSPLRGRSSSGPQDDDDAPVLHSRSIKSSDELPSRSLRMFTYNKFGSEDYRQLLTFVVTFSCVVAYAFMSFFIVRQIARENLCGIKDLLQLHGMPHYVHWILLLLHALLFRGITSIMVCLSLELDFGHGAIVSNSEPFIVFLIVYVHQLSLTFFNFLVAIYVRHVHMCGITAVATGVLSFYLPETLHGLHLLKKYPDLTLAIIFPNWCLRHVIRNVVDHETDEKGLAWDNLFEIVRPEKEKISVGAGLLMMSLMGVVYLSLAAYLDMTSPSKLAPQTYKWYQFREKLREKKEGQSLHQLLLKDIELGKDNDFDKPPVYEEPRTTRKCLVRIRNLSKNYGKHKVALDSISMNIYHEEITVILGHSGCGKSTLISILAGLVHPSNGYAIVKGLDARVDSRRAREFIGVCPQKLVSFNLLTVRQHLKLCYRLKGYSSSQAKEPVETLLKKLKLWEVRTDLPSRLTNEELRRLGIAMALVDLPKVLLLDQPTQGMDTIGRREMWKLLHSLKRHHTIIITTNYMDEAEHLADRLGFLAHGRLVCFGTLSFLEEQYATGYFLRIIPFPQSSNRLDTPAIIGLVKKHVEGEVTVRRHTKISDVDNLVLGLPANERDVFADLCEELEASMSDFKIFKYTIRRVSLNDIFIRICSSVASESHGMDFYVRRNSAGDVKSILFSEVPRLQEEDVPIEADWDPEPGQDKKKKKKKRHYFLALLRKRWTLLKSGGYGVALHFLIPLIFVWIVVFQAKVFVDPSEDNPIKELTVTIEGRTLSPQVFYRMGMDDTAVNYSRHMSRVLNPYGKELERADQITTRMYELLLKDPKHAGYAKDGHPVALEFRKLGVEDPDNYDFVGYFASGAMDGPAIAVNLMSNVYLSAISAGEQPRGRRSRHLPQSESVEDRSYRVTATNSPMPSLKDQESLLEEEEEEECGATCILLGMLMSFSISFICHFCVVLPMTERMTGMRHLQLMSGVPSHLYWLADYVVDCVIMFLAALFIILIFLADLSRTFHSVAIIFSLWLICILYLMWGGLLYVYFMSAVLPVSVNGYNLLAVIHVCFGIIPMLWLTLAPPEGGAGIFWRNMLELLFPPYTVTAIFYNYFGVASKRNICRVVDPYIQEVCNRDKKPHPHYVNSGGGLNKKELFEEIAKIDPKLAQCCDQLCLESDTCFRPPNVFNMSKESWNSPGIVTDCFALLVQGFIFWGLLIIVDQRYFQRLTQRLVLAYIEGRRKRLGEDVDGVYKSKKLAGMRRESMIVRATSVEDEESFPDDVALLSVDLTKSTTSKMIIKDFCLEVKTGQCVSILGRGSSGKSCILQMIAGVTIPTKGNCHVRGANLNRKRSLYLSQIGYAPQQNCLYPELTGGQMLELMGRLRGIPSNLLNTHVVKWLNVMGLSKVGQERCKSYGDGMCQRLRVAMACIGEPEIILLDEPTSSVDPSSREKLWSVIDHLNQQGRTVIFSTYNTEEALNMSDKVVIVADGAVQAIGEPEQLQRMYGKGHTILFKLKRGMLASHEIMAVAEERIALFKQFVLKTFRFIDLLDQQDGMLTYFLRDARLTWAEVHRRADFMAVVFPDVVDHYEVSEGQIDDIFVFLTDKSTQDMGTPRKSIIPEFDEVKPKRQSGNADKELKELKASQKRLRNSKILA